MCWCAVKKLLTHSLCVYLCMCVSFAAADAGPHPSVSMSLSVYVCLCLCVSLCVSVCVSWCLYYSCCTTLLTAVLIISTTWLSLSFSSSVKTRASASLFMRLWVPLPWQLCCWCWCDAVRDQLSLKCSAVLRLLTIWPQIHGLKSGGCCALFRRGNGSPSNTMWPGPRPSSVPSGILIHSSIWPQYKQHYR